MKILIIEDEDLAVKKLTKTLGSLDQATEVMGTADSIRSAVKWLRENPQPDLILMDIELADGQSFEIFEKVEVKCPVIFTTSYDEFAVKAFKVNSVDYLLKPVQKEDLEAALNKYQKLRKSFEANTTTAFNVDLLVSELQKQLRPKDFRKRFLVKNANKLVSVETEQIAYFFSDNGLNFFMGFDGKKYLVDYLMDEIEKMLDPDNFFRISRSMIVTIDSIERIDDYFGNRLILKLKPPTDKEALVSRERVAEFKRWMGK